MVLVLLVSASVAPATAQSKLDTVNADRMGRAVCNNVSALDKARYLAAGKSLEYQVNVLELYSSGVGTSKTAQDRRKRLRLQRCEPTLVGADMFATFGADATCKNEYSTDKLASCPVTYLSQCATCDPGRTMTRQCGLEVLPVGGKLRSEGFFLAVPGGNTQCTACPRGKYQPRRGESGCATCPTGSVQNKSGSDECEVCGEGKYVNHTCTKSLPFFIMLACVHRTPSTGPLNS